MFEDKNNFRCRLLNTLQGKYLYEISRDLVICGKPFDELASNHVWF